MNTFTEPNTMIRCMDCGRLNHTSNSVCGFCGASLHLIPPVSSDQSNNSNPRRRPLSANQSESVESVHASVLFSRALARPSDEPASTQPQSEDRRIAKAELSGRVIASEPVIHEQPSFDWCRLAARLLWFLLLVVSPFMLLRSVLVHLGALPMIFAIVGFLFVLKFFSPMNILALVNLNMLLNPLRRNQEEQVPVRYFRVRDSNEREWIVRLKGQIEGGNIAPDDLISGWGRWRAGTLELSRAYNHRTLSYVIARRSQSWMTLAVTVGAVLLLGIYFFQPLHTMWQTMQGLGKP